MNRDAETVPARHETPDVAELRRLAEAATPGPWEWDDNHARPGLRHGRSFGGVLFRCGALYGPDAADAAFIAAANPAVVLALLDRLAHMREARDNARGRVAELEARLADTEAGLDRVAVAMGCGDEVEGRGVYRDDVDGMVEYATTLRQTARDHDECPVLCAEHDGPESWEWPLSCQECHGSGMAGPSIIDFIDGVVPDNLAHPGECESCAGSGRDCNSLHNLITMDEAKQMESVVLDDLAVAEARMAAVRALHRAVGIYDECDCDAPDPATHLDVDDVGLTCNLMYRVCAECCRDDVYQTEDCASYHAHRLDEDYHCPTIRALDEEPQP